MKTIIDISLTNHIVKSNGVKIWTSPREKKCGLRTATDPYIKAKLFIEA